MSAVAPQRSLHLPSPSIHEPSSVREARHLRLVWSRPEPLAQHIYRRRRLVAAIAVLTFAIGIGFSVQAGLSWYSSHNAPSTAVNAAVPMSQTTYTVGSGDTLWSIATKASPPGKDVRPLVAKLSKERGGAPLQIGEKVSISR